MSAEERITGLIAELGRVRSEEDPRYASAQDLEALRGDVSRVLPALNSTKAGLAHLEELLPNLGGDLGQAQRALAAVLHQVRGLDHAIADIRETLARQAETLQHLSTRLDEIEVNRLGNSGPAAVELAAQIEEDNVEVDVSELSTESDLGQDLTSDGDRSDQTQEVVGPAVEPVLPEAGDVAGTSAPDFGTTSPGNAAALLQGTQDLAQTVLPEPENAGANPLFGKSPDADESLGDDGEGVRARIPPELRGGRPRRPPEGAWGTGGQATSDDGAPDAANDSRDGIAPDVGTELSFPVVCWQAAGEWHVGIEGPWQTEAEAWQDGVQLSLDTSAAVWELSRAEPVQVRQANGMTTTVSITSGDEGYLLFKLTGTRGHRVRRPRTGPHLILVPADYTISEATDADVASLDPSPLEGYAAYVAYTGAKEMVVLEHDGRRVELQRGVGLPGLRLVGDLVAAATDDVCATFGAPPAMEAESWAGVGSVVVGEEGGGGRRWRTSFRPVPDEAIQLLPDEFSDRDGGWYFVRLYDPEERLIESFDFQFLNGLDEVTVHQPSAPLLGFGEQYIEFVHDARVHVDVADSSVVLGKTTKGENEKRRTVFTLEDRPEADRLLWCASRRGIKVRLETRLNRVWWAIAEAQPGGADWTNRPVTVGRSSFSALSEQRLWLRFPAPRWAEVVRAGFDGQLGSGSWKSINHTTTSTECAMWLRDFGDNSLLQQPGHYSFSVLVARAGGIVDIAPLINVPVEAECLDCGQIVDSIEAEREHLRHTHVRDHLDELTYEELRAWLNDPGLPVRVFTCPHEGLDGCRGFTSKKMYANDPAGEDDMWAHINSKHPNRQHLLHQINDADRIREILNKELPRLARCVLCGSGDRSRPFDVDQASGLEKATEHMLQAHYSKLFELR